MVMTKPAEMSTNLTRQRSSLRDQYKTMQRARTYSSAQFTALVLQFLLLPGSGKFNDYFNNLLKSSLESDPNWQPAKASKAFRHLETYALNLYNYPWRNEFKTIKVSFLNEKCYVMQLLVIGIACRTGRSLFINKIGVDLLKKIIQTDLDGNDVTILYSLY